MAQSEVYGEYATAATQKLETVQFAPGLEQVIEREDYRFIVATG